MRHRRLRPALSGRGRWLAAGLATAVLIASAVGLWWLVNSRTIQLAGDLVARVDTPAPVVALTFDDGPVDGRVQPLLSTLHDVDVRATFFVIGEVLAETPESGRRLVAAGHQLGNHSYTHARMVFRSGDFYAREIEETDAQIRATGYEGQIVFRPPYGKKLLGLPLYLARTGRTSVTWDIEPESDPAIAGNTERIVANVLSTTRPGSIILLHPWYESGEAARRAIPAIVAGLRERGFRFVTIAELLALRDQGQD